MEVVLKVIHVNKQRFSPMRIDASNRDSAGNGFVLCLGGDIEQFAWASPARFVLLGRGAELANVVAKWLQVLNSQLL